MTARPPTPPELHRGEHAATPASFGTIAVAGRYRLDAVHGQGSSATVYRATDLRLDRPVTVKLFDPRVAADPSLRARFRRQTAKASRLAHPHVAEILDGGFATELGDGERPFVVTEPAGPWSLRELLDRKGRLPPRQAVELAHQLASALSHAHRQGTVHTDVKPENVLVDEGGGHAKLVDFSLSFVSDRTGAMTRETIARRAAYLAPEQVRGEPVGVTTDVYALGVLLYEMLAGRPPFVAATPEATAERRVFEHARPVGAFDPSIPAGVEAVIARALERAPERRWPTVEQLDAELGRFDTSQLEPVNLGSLPRPASPIPTSPRPAGRRGLRWSLGLVVPIVAAILAVGLALLLLGPLARGLSEPSERPSVLGSLFGRAPAVPGVVGLTVPEAEAVARTNGLELSVVGERLTERTPAGVIVQQSPIAGTEPTSPQPLRVTTSAGVTVPDVRGKPLAEAEAALAAAGWRAARVDRGIHPGRPPDTVVFQHPPPGEVAAEPGEMLLAVAE